MSVLSRWAIVLFILSALVYGVIEWQKAHIKPTDAIDTELTPEFIAETLKSAIYNENGNLSHEIEADRMEHYEGLAFTHFEQPNYTLYPKNTGSPWQVKAKEATLYKNNRVILKNDVLITSMEEDSLIQQIQCKTLELDLKTNIISSDQDIMVLGKNFTMYGSGLIIDLNTTQMTLIKHVQTIYKKTNG